MLSRIARRGYHKVVVEHFNNPKNIGKLDPKDPNVGTGLVGAPACFHKDTRVATADGSHTIGELYTNTNNGTNIIHVTSFNLQTSVFETRPARVVYSGKKKMDTITISTGETIIVTPDHQFLTMEEAGTYVYKENSIITEQDRLVSFCMKKEENVSIISREYYGEDDCYTLQVEVNNNYCIVTHDNVGIVVKNCGDVIKIQIKVDENDTIVDSKCKVFGCLAGNVRISTPGIPAGKQIKDCNVGDEIWAWNGEKIVKNEIEQIYVHYVPSDELMYLEFEGSSYFKFVCTKSHIWWKANDTPVEAETLNVGDECLSIDETVNIHNGLKVIRKETELTYNLLRDIEKNEEGLYKVYDIKCKEGANVFFVGRIASHNCASAFANTSLASDIIKGKKIDEVVQITNMDLAKATHSNQIKLHCSALAADAIKAAVNDIKKKRSEA